MAFRALLAGSALVLSLSACSGGADDPAAEPAGGDSVASAPTDGAAPTDAATATATPAAEASATPAASESAKPTPTPTPTPSATPTKAAAAAPAAVAAVAPASFGRCAVCHTANKGGENKLGPNLWGAFGSKMGQGSFAYSDALKSAGLTADEATLHKWLENPRALVPGNSMSFPGIKDAAKRQEIIDYLKRQR